jgi:hypothetical protein
MSNQGTEPWQIYINIALITFYYLIELLTQDEINTFTLPHHSSLGTTTSTTSIKATKWLNEN